MGQRFAVAAHMAGPLLLFAAAAWAEGEGDTAVTETVPVRSEAAPQRIEPLPDGRVRLPSRPQAIEAEAAPAGIVVRTTGRGERGWFTLRAVEIGRHGAVGEKVSEGRVIVEGTKVHIFRANLSEEITTSADGVRQDFVISAAPLGRGELQLVLEARGARIATRGEAISLTLPGGRELIYHELKVTDAEGRVLPARFEPQGEDRLRIGVDDRGARYPLRIDPTITAADGENVIPVVEPRLSAREARTLAGW